MPLTKHGNSVSRGVRETLLSLAIHAALLLVLAWLTFPQLRDISLSLELGEQLDLDSGSLDWTVSDASLAAPPTSSSVTTTAVSQTSIAQLAVTTPTAPAHTTTTLAPNDTPQQVTTTLLTEATKPLSGRQNRGMLAALGGGSEGSERAVDRALDWLARHQLPTGAWCYDHTVSAACRGQCGNPTNKPDVFGGAYCSATAMAILPFLAAGETHKNGRYQPQLNNALNYLRKHALPRSEGACFYEKEAASHGMYHHGIVTIALCEAVAMTGDRELIPLAQRSLDFLVAAQDPKGGGWRYAPRTPGDASALGWCLMGLKSGTMANLKVPPSVFLGAATFLDRSVSVDGGARYGYLTSHDLPNERYDDGRSTTAIGLLSRLYLGWRHDNETLLRGAGVLQTIAPQPDNLYFSYYATQVMHHIGGEHWAAWNPVMRDALVATQETRGHAAGSWYAPDELVKHGGLVEHGGRLAATSLATMTLEVYYRHLPLYQTAQETLFPLE